MDEDEKEVVVFEALRKALESAAEEFEKQTGDKLDAGSVVMATSAFHASVTKILVEAGQIDWMSATRLALQGVAEVNAAAEMADEEEQEEQEETVPFTFPMPAGEA